MKLILAGCSGFIGQALVDHLVSDGHELILLSRSPKNLENLQNDHVKALGWDGKTLKGILPDLENSDGIINLSGEGVAKKRWTARRKKEILESRVDSTNALIDVLQDLNSKPAFLLNASAVGYYGPVDSGVVTEETPAGHGFLGETCAQWEQAAVKAKEFGVRVVLLRIGVVLERGGGALERMIPPFLFFVGGPLGSGKQWFPWVHRDDVVGLILHAIDHTELHGPMNVTAPNPVNMKDLCTTLGGVMNRPSWAPVPGFVLQLLLGEMSELMLKGQRAVPKKAQDSGYTFKYPQLRGALASILKK